MAIAMPSLFQSLLTTRRKSGSNRAVTVTAIAVVVLVLMVWVLQQLR